MPLLTWVVSLATIMSNPQSKRLGDLAAGTFVVHARHQPARRGLHRLCPADLAVAAVGAEHNRRVVRHVLRLERCHLDAEPVEPTADAGGEDALAGIGRGTGDQQPAGHLAALPARSAKPAASTAVAAPTAADNRAERRMSSTAGRRPAPSVGRSSARPA